MVLRSSNGQVTLQNVTTRGGIASVVYEGPTLQVAEVLWSVSIVCVNPCAFTSCNFGLRHLRTAGIPVFTYLDVDASVAGDRFQFGGATVVELISGDVLRVFGIAALFNTWALEANGFKVVVR